jgi:hypothetical protein
MGLLFRNRFRGADCIHLIRTQGYQIDAELFKENGNLIEWRREQSASCDDS